VRSLEGDPSVDLVSFTPDPFSEQHILWLDGDTFGVDGAQVCVLKKAHQIGLSSLLNGHHCTVLEVQCLKLVAESAPK
jgi:hypothetical protein